MPSLDLISGIASACGWGYLLAWSSAMYAQPWLNYKRHSIEGLSVDFVLHSTIGFIYYSVYTVTFFFSYPIRKEYRKRHYDHDHMVKIQDVLFSLHGVLMSLFLVGQVVYYRKPHHVLSKKSMMFLAALLVYTGAIMVWAFQDIEIRALDMVKSFGFIKMMMSFIKYFPQAVKNFRDKSTEGFATMNEVLDLTGGILSLLHLLLNAYVDAHSSNLPGMWMKWFVDGDEVKLGLAVLSILFDVLFIGQGMAYKGRSRPKPLPMPPSIKG